MNKLKILINNSKMFINTSNWKIIVLFLIIWDLFSLLYISYNQDYINGLLYCLASSLCSIVFFLLIFFNTINTYVLYDKNLFHIIRLKNKKEYLYNLIINVLFNNSIIFFLNILILIVGLNFLGRKFIIYSWMNYYVPNIIYLFFYIVRYFFLIQIVSILNVFLVKLIGKKSTFLINAINCSTFYFSLYNPKLMIDSFNKFQLLMSEYIRFHMYTNFSLEILFSTIYISILLLICYVLFKFSIKKISKIGV